MLQGDSDVTGMLRRALDYVTLARRVVVSEEHKVEAVRRVAGSLTFHRADVLKTLLGYLSAQEALGRAHEVTESEIALQVMHRGPAFSPESDSSVRTRFLALRKKLDEYYAGEGRDSPIRRAAPANRQLPGS